MFISHHYGGWKVQDPGTSWLYSWWKPSFCLSDSHYLVTHSYEATNPIVRTPRSWPHQTLITSWMLLIQTPPSWASWCEFFRGTQFSPSYCGIRQFWSCYAVFSPARLFVTPWTLAHQVLLPTELSRQAYCNRLPFPPPGDLPHPGIKPTSPILAGDSLPLGQLGSPQTWRAFSIYIIPWFLWVSTFPVSRVTCSVSEATLGSFSWASIRHRIS